MDREGEQSPRKQQDESYLEEFKYDDKHIESISQQMAKIYQELDLQALPLVFGGQPMTIINEVEETQ